MQLHTYAFKNDRLGFAVQSLISTKLEIRLCPNKIEI